MAINFFISAPLYELVNQYKKTVLLSIKLALAFKSLGEARQSVDFTNLLLTVGLKNLKKVGSSN